MTDDNGVVLARFLTGDELAAFSRALEEWAKGLPPRQQAFLRQVLVDALEAAVEDISGFVEPGAFLEFHETETEDFAVSSTATVTEILSAYVSALAAAADDDPGDVFRTHD